MLLCQNGCRGLDDGVGDGGEEFTCDFVWLCKRGCANDILCYGSNYNVDHM